MTSLHVSGFAAISSAGMQAGALAERAGAAHPGVPVEGLYPQPLPSPMGHALIDFDVRAQLGRKGTSFYDRATSLAVVTCGAALEDAGVEINDESRLRVGVALGTTVGSFKSTSDFSMETLVQPKPYLVNPVLFPNTVMNCAAGQAAIRYGLRGVNATITGGPMAFLNAMRYAGNAISRGYVDTMLVGAVEEFTPHRAWIAALCKPGSAPAGEAAVVFAVRGALAGAAPPAEILAVATGFGSAGQAPAALAGCVLRALREADVEGTDIVCHATDDVDSIGPVNEALGWEPKHLNVMDHFGDCGAATAALAMATVLDQHRADPGRDGQLTLLTASTADGAVGAAIFRGWSRGTDRS